MRDAGKVAPPNDQWKPIDDPEDHFSTGIPDFDRLLNGGLRRPSLAVFDTDETVGTEDLDLLFFPAYLNFLYQSRGIVAVLPSNDSPHAFRARLTRYVTRRRFDSRVRVVDYVGEDRGLQYVVSLHDGKADGSARRPSAKARDRANERMLAAERAAQGRRGKPILQLTAFEVFDTLLGAEKAAKLLYHGVKQYRMQGNLMLGLLAPGVGCAAAVRRMAETEFSLHRDEVGLLIRGVRPAFSSFVVTADPVSGPPSVAFVPRPN